MSNCRSYEGVICIGGEIASGKTTLAKVLAEHFCHAVTRSFGDVVRRRALSEGKPLDRETLQAVGLSLVAAGWPSFVDHLLADLPSSTELLVVEGIRHREAVDEIASRNLSDPAALGMARGLRIELDTGESA